MSVSYANAKGDSVKLDVERLIVSIGRVANTTGLNVDAVGLQLDERGAIVVDADCKTNLPMVGPLAMWCAARCWRTRPKKRAWPWPSASPASMAMSTRTPFHG